MSMGEAQLEAGRAGGEKLASELASDYVECPVCNQTVKKKGRYGHWKTNHADLPYQEWQGKFKPAPPPEEAPGAPLYKGEPDATGILREILGKHPDIPKRAVDEVCSWAEYGPIHPQQLVSLLSSIRGIAGTTAYIVASKYSLALQKAQSEGRLQQFPVYPPYTPQTVTPLYGQPVLGQPGIGVHGILPQPAQPGYGGFTAPQPQPSPWYYAQPPQDVRSIVREEVRILVEGLKPKEEPIVEVEEPVRNQEGQVILGPDDKPIVKKMRVPVSQMGFIRGEDSEERVLKRIQLYREVWGGGQVTEERIREIVKAEAPKPPEKPEVTADDVKKAASEAAQGAVQAFVEAHEKVDVEERRHRELVDEIRASAGARTVEGYKDDSVRLLGQGVQELGNVIRERKPVEILVRAGETLLTGSPGKEFTEGSQGGLAGRLKARGWVSER